jgi:hypothetical protein
VLPDQPKVERKVSDSKGKAKETESNDQVESSTSHLSNTTDSMQLDKEEEKEEEEMDDTEENEKGDPNEEILMTVVPKANINGLKYSGGIRTRKFTEHLSV